MDAYLVPRNGPSIAPSNGHHVNHHNQPHSQPHQLQDHPFVPIDMNLCREWIYPTNKEVRGYQKSISMNCLLHNTLVVLPTGLGKTLIAAVVMYNYYRWFPTGKIIFMAPTKPLVAQQIEACHGIMGIPQEHTAELMGGVKPEEREKLWSERRVFYCTPQSLNNDLMKGALDPRKIVCIVIDGKKTH
jgi:ERCC4-related helicase